ncbi:MAG: Arabinose operon regulatory protein [Tenericutes bacterium ADurb.Bin087]|nr:MAG: Arabinose operon regulatory protein [Tenericutes bacterium ADurb.Bin087]
MEKKKHSFKVFGNEKELLTYFPYRDDCNSQLDDYPIHIEAVGITKPDSNYRVLRNNWNIYTIEYIISGNGYLEYNGKNYKLSSGDMYILTPNSIQRYGAEKDNPYEKIWINFRSKNFIKILESLKLNKSPVFHFPDAYEYLKEIYTLKDTHHFVEDSSYICYKLLFNLLIDIKESENKKVNIFPQYLSDVLAYIDKKTPDPVSIEELTKIANVSQVCLINNFKKHIGETPYSYQLKTRLKLAKMYLTNSDKTLDEIAELCFFCDAFALSKAFKKVYGLSPREYRQSEI